MAQFVSSWPRESYQLLDFGRGRKLERFGDVVLDRPCPSAVDRPLAPSLWKRADVVLGAKGKVIRSRLNREKWPVRYGDIEFHLKVTPFGHVGLFPEQISNWSWLSGQLPALWQAGRIPCKALNLFAYTGGTTLVLASCGVEVTHVDASAPAVNWAKENADASGLADAPVRWIVDDARKFVARELRRGNRYRVVVMDPPTFGHGPRGKKWDVAEDLDALLRDVFQLLEDSACLLLLTGHSEVPNEHELDLQLRELCGEYRQVGAPEALGGRAVLSDRAGRALDAGYFVRAKV